MKRRTDASCPKDCPRRCAQPNCHNEETCPIWAKHMAGKRALQAQKVAVISANDDLRAVRATVGRRIERKARH